MQGNVFIKDDETLQQMLYLKKHLPDAITISDRMFCEIPIEDYNGKIDSTLGDGRKTMSTVYFDYHTTKETVYVLVGEDDGYGVDGTGSRDFKNNPITKEEFVAWSDKYEIERFHINFPRKKENLDG